jgi:hypothetical protein
LLVRLSNEGINYALNGTFALFFFQPKLADHFTINDCDIFLDTNANNITKCISLLRELNFTLRVWENEIDFNMELLSQLQGKFYFRTRLNEVQLDFTYEHSISIHYNPIVFETTCVKVLEEETILTMKKSRHREKDILFLETYKQLCQTSKS